MAPDSPTSSNEPVQPVPGKVILPQAEDLAPTDEPVVGLGMPNDKGRYTLNALPANQTVRACPGPCRKA